jgi:hypothetical protein
MGHKSMCTIGKRTLAEDATTVNFWDDSKLDVWPYIVGDAAVLLCTHILKCLETDPTPGSHEGKVNHKHFNTCRGDQERIWCPERALVFSCSKSRFWGNVIFTRSAIVACCWLHSFVELHRVDMLEEAAGSCVLVVYFQPVSLPFLYGLKDSCGLFIWIK